MRKSHNKAGYIFTSRSVSARSLPYRWNRSPHRRTPSPERDPQLSGTGSPDEELRWLHDPVHAPGEDVGGDPVAVRRGGRDTEQERAEPRRVSAITKPVSADDTDSDQTASRRKAVPHGPPGLAHTNRSVEV